MHDRTGSSTIAGVAPPSPVTTRDLLGLEWGRLRRDAVFWITLG
jgi:hypothetical protein